MSSARVFGIPGTQFDGGVAHAGDVAQQVEQKPSLPDRVTGVLMELQPSTPAEKQEWNDLIADRFSLNKRTMEYVERKLAARRVDLEAKHEEAKGAVREQVALLDNLKQRMAADQQEVVRAQNVLRRAQTAAFDAAQALKSLDRFVSQKEREASQRRVIEADKKVQMAESQTGELGQNLNYLATVTIPAALKKRDELIAAEMELAAKLAGHEPQTLGILAR